MMSMSRSTLAHLLEGRRFKSGDPAKSSSHTLPSLSLSSLLSGSASTVSGRDHMPFGFRLTEARCAARDSPDDDCATLSAVESFRVGGFARVCRLGILRRGLACDLGAATSGKRVISPLLM